MVWFCCYYCTTIHFNNLFLHRLRKSHCIRPSSGQAVANSARGPKSLATPASKDSFSYPVIILKQLDQIVNAVLSKIFRCGDNNLCHSIPAGVRSDGFTHRPWPRAPRNSFLWRLITNWKFAKLRRGIVSQFTLERTKIPTCSPAMSNRNCLLSQKVCYHLNQAAHWKTWPHIEWLN